MVTTSSNKGFSVPTVGGDSGVWGTELNTTITDLDTILGGSITFNSSAAATVTLSASQAQFNRVVFTGTPASSMTLNIMTAPPSGGFGNFDIWNNTSTSANSGAGFNITCQVVSTSTGTTVTVPVSNMRMINVDTQNVQFADQVIIPTTTLPPVLNGYISGLIISNDVTTPNTVLDMAAGIATESSNNAYLQSAAAFTKTSSSVWAQGSGNGGMGTGLTFTAGTYYHVYIISNSASSNIDFYFDTSSVAANKPANTNFFRRIGSRKALSSAAIWQSVVQFGDNVVFKSYVNEQSNANIPSTPTLVTLGSIPSGFDVWPRIRFFGQGTNGTTFTIYSPDESSASISSGANSATADMFTGVFHSSAIGDGIEIVTRSNASAQIGWFQTAGSGLAQGWLNVVGYTDNRGKDSTP